MATTTLVFPVTMPEAQRFASEALAHGDRVIGAASVPLPDETALFSSGAALPFVYEDGFCEALTSLLHTEEIGRIFCPHLLIWNFLQERLPLLAPTVQLLPKTWHTPTGDDCGYYDLLRSLAPASRNRPLHAVEVEAVMRQAASIVGQSGLHKLAALLAIGSDLPNGDIVEVGAFYGRSAFVLGWLARRYVIGALLCIDPWNTEEARQEVPHVIKKAFSQIDYTTAFAGFLSNMVPCFRGGVNYLRMHSHQASMKYKPGMVVESEAFGSAQYQGECALVHIDGNHDELVVRQDIADWSPTIKPGGWLVIDDYIWSFGDGPRKAGDAFLQKPTFGVDCAFVLDGALFLKRRAGDR